MSILRHLLDKLSVYLPLIVMALLALGSWWLVRSVPGLLQPDAKPVVRQDPDYSLSRFSVKSFNASGRMTREVGGEKAQHFPANKTLVISQIRVTAESDNGARMDARATQGRVTDDGKTITLTGQANAIRYANGNSPKIELQGERFVALPDEDRLLSSAPVRIVRGHDVFTSASMDFNGKTGTYVLDGRVRGTLLPTH